MSNEDYLVHDEDSLSFEMEIDFTGAPTAERVVGAGIIAVGPGMGSDKHYQAIMDMQWVLDNRYLFTLIDNISSTAKELGIQIGFARLNEGIRYSITGQGRHQLSKRAPQFSELISPIRNGMDEAFVQAHKFLVEQNSPRTWEALAEYKFKCDILSLSRLYHAMKIESHDINLIKVFYKSETGNLKVPGIPDPDLLAEYFADRYRATLSIDNAEAPSIRLFA